MKIETLKYYYNRCNPREALEPRDERNVDIDAVGEVGEQVRGVRWVDLLARRITLSEVPVRALFSGLPGSGKSTELFRLAEKLGDRKGANFLPVIANAEELLDLASEIDVPDILASLLYEAERVVLRAEGRDPQDALQDGVLTRFWGWLTTTEISLKEAKFNVPTAGELVAEMKTRPSLRSRIREIVGAHLPRFLADVRKGSRRSVCVPERWGTSVSWSFSTRWRNCKGSVRTFMMFWPALKQYSPTTRPTSICLFTPSTRSRPRSSLGNASRACCLCL